MLYVCPWGTNRPSDSAGPRARGASFRSCVSPRVTEIGSFLPSQWHIERFFNDLRDNYNQILEQEI